MVSNLDKKRFAYKGAILVPIAVSCICKNVLKEEVLQQWGSYV